MLKKVLSVFPFKNKSDGRKAIVDVVQGFSNTIKTLEEATTLNESIATEHAQEIVKRNTEIKDLDKHNEIAKKLKTNLTALIS